MSVLKKLASAQERRDEIPNIDLAKSIAKEKEVHVIKELVDNLTNKNTGIQNDCIKVLYELGALSPKLIVPYYDEFIKHLTSKNNRMQWGAMTALQSITKEIPETIYRLLPKILDAADKGSVITKDNAVNILTQLAQSPKYNRKVFPILNEFLIKAATNQLPMYAENAMYIIDEKDKPQFIKTLQLRLNEFEKKTKKKRVEKVIAKLSRS